MAEQFRHGLYSGFGSSRGRESFAGLWIAGSMLVVALGDEASGSDGPIARRSGFTVRLAAEEEIENHSVQASRRAGGCPFNQLHEIG